MKKVIVLILTIVFACIFTASALAAGKSVKSIKLNASSITLNAGETYQLKATISPENASNKKVSYSSSNKKVATVDKNGKITGVSAGSCTITAKTSNGKTAKVSVKVNSKPAVTSVSLNMTSINMLGKAIQLKASCQPNNSDQSITWSSSNKKVATVSSSGTVTPKGYGNCTITAKSKNGKTATCKVTVNKSNKITKTFTIGDSWPYLMKDTFTITVNGLTGKITSNDCFQTKRDAMFLFTISADGIKAYNITSSYIEFRSTYTVKIGVKAGKQDIGAELVTRTNYYRFDNQGNLSVINNSCSDIFGLCE